tara:strand:- start:26 stop:334 length:309 start_codon:yes stop_codon:yes gene_type:complete
MRRIVFLNKVFEGLMLSLDGEVLVELIDVFVGVGNYGAALPGRRLEYKYQDATHERSNIIVLLRTMACGWVSTLMRICPNIKNRMKESAIISVGVLGRIVIR